MSLISDLVRLHQVDAQVRALRGRLESAERYLAAQTRLLDQLDEQKTELEQRKRQTEAVQANNELETKSIDERIEKLRDELNSAATTKQYNALLSELDTMKVQRSEFEDRILGEMEDVEAILTQLADVKGQHEERVKVKDVATAQLAERKTDVGDRLAELEGERTVASSAIPPASLRIFDEVANIHDGESLASIEVISKRHREYACSECHITVPFEHISLLLGGQDSLVRCTACLRILYMQDEVRGTLVKD